MWIILVSFVFEQLKRRKSTICGSYIVFGAQHIVYIMSIDFSYEPIF